LGGGGWDPFPLPLALGYYLFVYLFILLFCQLRLLQFVSSFSLETKKTKKQSVGKNMTGGKCDGTSIECFIAPHTPRLLLLGGDLNVTDLSRWMRRASGTRKMGKFMFSHLSHFLGNSVICICCCTYADESSKM
jgi:hypothetical protein